MSQFLCLTEEFVGVSSLLLPCDSGRLNSWQMTCLHTEGSLAPEVYVSFRETFPFFFSVDPTNPAFQPVRNQLNLWLLL